MHKVGTTHLGAPGPPGAPWWVVVPTWAPLTYPLIPLHHLPPEKIHRCSLSLSLSRVLALKPADFDLVARSSVSNLFRGIVAWYVTPTFVQLVFALVVYILNN